MPLLESMAKVGVYADVSNLFHNGGQRLQYDVLREFACRDGAEAVRLSAYATLDAERAQRDAAYREGATSFHNKLRDYGYKVIVKEVRWFRDETGNRIGKANADLDLAVDVLLQSERLDRVLIASGDGDFAQVVRGLQNRGLRVEVVGLDHTAVPLREEADLFVSGFLIPGMIPIQRRRGGPRSSSREELDWGELGSRVRGWCYWFEADRGFGYLRFLREIGPGLWFTDARHPDSPYQTAFVRAASLPREVRPEQLPSRSLVFECTLEESERGDGLQALDLELISTLDERHWRNGSGR